MHRFREIVIAGTALGVLFYSYYLSGHDEIQKGVRCCMLDASMFGCWDEYVRDTSVGTWLSSMKARGAWRVALCPWLSGSEAYTLVVHSTGKVLASDAGTSYPDYVTNPFG